MKKAWKIIIYSAIALAVLVSGSLMSRLYYVRQNPSIAFDSLHERLISASASLEANSSPSPKEIPTAKTTESVPTSLEADSSPSLKEVPTAKTTESAPPSLEANSSPSFKEVPTAKTTESVPTSPEADSSPSPKEVPTAKTTESAPTSPEADSSPSPKEIPTAKTTESAPPSPESSSEPKASETPKPSASPEPSPKIAQNKDIVGVLFLGIDSTEDREEKGMRWRSDVMIACAIDMRQNRITAITIPRDTRCKIDRLDKKNSKSVTDKINTAYTYGGGPSAKGHENALSAVNRVLGTNIQYYVSIDMDSIAPLTDSIGGVEIVLDVTIDGVGKKGETVLLDGKKATAFIRKRHGVTGGSDIARTQRQKQFIDALAKKVKAMNPVKLIPGLYASMSSHIRTNLSIEQIVALSGVLGDTTGDFMCFETIPGKAKSISGKSYYVFDEKKTRELAYSAFSGS